jgi:hypothetical protein
MHEPRVFGMEEWTDFTTIKNEAWLEYENLDGDRQYTVSII